MIKQFLTKKALKLYLSLTCLLLHQHAIAQETFNDSLRVRFILDIAKYVHWQDEDTIQDFKIGILSKDSTLYREFLKPWARKKLHKKKLRILLFHRIADIRHSQVLFVNNQSGYDADEVLLKIRDANTLMIGENFEFHKTMINFLIADGYPRFEVNEMMVNRERLSVTPLFLGLAVKTKADWQKIYQKTEEKLQAEKQIVKAKNIELEKQKQAIIAQRQLIAKQNTEIERGKQELAQQNKRLNKLLQSIKRQESQLKQNTLFLENRERELQAQRKEMIAQEAVLQKQKGEIALQEKKIDEQKNVLSEQLQQIRMQKLVLYLFIIILLIVVAMVFFIYRGYKIKKQANALLAEKNQAISKQNVEILEQKKEITDSIQYARRIQTAILPPPEMIEQLLPGNFFILNKPRDIVSGDYYWMSNHGSTIIIAAADCTGHGVPGAFMSMLGMAYMNEIINNNEIQAAGKILDRLREHVINALHQSGKKDEAKDGMDIALVVFNIKTKELQFAGANNPLYIVRNLPGGKAPADTELIEIKGDKMPIGIHDVHHPFTSHSIQLNNGDTFYVFSDGYADQFGGKDALARKHGGKKFKYRRFKNILQQIHHRSMPEQKHILNKEIEAWRGELPQVDDILVIGIHTA